jgi:hypothetical protein
MRHERLDAAACLLLLIFPDYVLDATFYHKTSFAPKYQPGLPISENTKTVAKNIAAPGIACIECHTQPAEVLVEMRCMKLVEMRCIELVEM